MIDLPRGESPFGERIEPIEDSCNTVGPTRKNPV